MAVSLYLRRAFDDARHRPSLATAHRTGLGNRDLVAHLGVAGLVVGDELRRHLLRLAVHRMLDAALDGDDYAFLHLVADNDALQFRFGAHGYFAFSLRTVWMRASSRRAWRIL